MEGINDQISASKVVARAVVQHGFGAALADNSDFLAALESLDASGSNALDTVLQFEGILRDALRTFGDNPRSVAACQVVGLHQSTRGRLRKVRRQAAARTLGKAEETWNRHYEPKVVADLSLAIYKLTTFPGAVRSTFVA